MKRASRKQGKKNKLPKPFNLESLIIEKDSIWEVLTEKNHKTLSEKNFLRSLEARVEEDGTSKILLLSYMNRNQ